MLPRGITAILGYQNCLGVVSGLWCRCEGSLSRRSSLLVRYTGVIVFCESLISEDHHAKRTETESRKYELPTMRDDGNRKILELPEGLPTASAAEMTGVVQSAIAILVR